MSRDVVIVFLFLRLVLPITLLCLSFPEYNMPCLGCGGTKEEAGRFPVASGRRRGSRSQGAASSRGQRPPQPTQSTGPAPVTHHPTPPTGEPPAIAPPVDSSVQRTVQPAREGDVSSLRVRTTQQSGSSDAALPSWPTSAPTVCRQQNVQSSSSPGLWTGGSAREGEGSTSRERTQNLSGESDVSVTTCLITARKQDRVQVGQPSPAGERAVRPARGGERSLSRKQTEKLPESTDIMPMPRLAIARRQDRPKIPPAGTAGQDTGPIISPFAALSVQFPGAGSPRGNSPRSGSPRIGSSRQQTARPTASSSPSAGHEQLFRPAKLSRQLPGRLAGSGENLKLREKQSQSIGARNTLDRPGSAGPPEQRSGSSPTRWTGQSAGPSSEPSGRSGAAPRSSKRPVPPLYRKPVPSAGAHSKHLPGSQFRPITLGIET